MKHLHFIAIFSMLLVSACGVFTQTSEEKQRNAQIIRERLDNRAYTIDVDYMVPLRGNSRMVDSFSITVDGDILNSHLPYFGAAQNVSYGGGNALSFKEQMSGYSDTGFVGDRRNIVIHVKTKEDIFVYNITVFDDGSADIKVNCHNRDDISYRGNLRTRDAE